MRIIALKFDTIDEAIEYTNDNHLASLCNSIVYDESGMFRLILKFEDYRTYEYFATKIGWELMATSEFFNL